MYACSLFAPSECSRDVQWMIGVRCSQAFTLQRTREVLEKQEADFGHTSAHGLGQALDAAEVCCM
jgi:hypothetical protein